jgi:hypothetical protein
MNRTAKTPLLRVLLHCKSCLHSSQSYIYVCRCWSHVGKVGSSGEQELSVGDGCNYVPTILHEMMHAAGINHEQSRSDRDTYVVINFANILDGTYNI